MSYKPVLLKYCTKRNAKLLEGKDTIILAQKDGKFYQVEEYIGLITKIYPKFSWNSEVPEFEVRFQGGKTYKIRAYLDPKSVENSFASIYGIFTKTLNGDLEFTCKGGMVRIYETLGQAGRVNPKYIYRFGVVHLSRVKESTRYPANLEGIEVLEENMLWTYSSNDLEAIEEKSKDIIEEEDTTIDFNVDNPVFINNSVEVELYSEMAELEKMKIENEITNNSVFPME